MLNTMKVRAGKIINDVPQGGASPSNLLRMLLPKGTLVWILEDGGLSNPHNPNDLWVRVKNVYQYRDLQPNTAGVVPFDCLEFGQYQGEISSLVVHSFQRNVQVSQGGSLLLRTMEALFRGMILDYDRLRALGISSYLMNRIQKDPVAIAKQIVNYMPKEVFAALKDGLVAAPGYSQDTFKKLEVAPQRLHISSSTSGGGIYLHGYKKAKEIAFTMRNAWYIGKTIDFGARFTSHSFHIKSNGGPSHAKNHYKIARRCEADGNGWYAVKMLDIPDTVSDRADILSIGEQALILLLHSTNCDLLHVAGADEIELRGYFFQQASALQDICQSVFAQVGWHTSMPSFTGANWSMPMFEGMNYEQAIWTRTLIPQTPEIDQNTQMAIFRRQPYRFSAKFFEGKKQLKLTDLPAPGSIIWATRDLPFKHIKDRLVILIIEIQLGENGIPGEERKKRGLSKTDHPTPYARYPAVQPLSEAQWILMP
ncbi:hypothetical protein V8E51_004070 [Hyaloscypha variabilis]